MNEAFKNLLKKAEKNGNLKFGYLVRCDDSRRPTEVATDKYFYLFEFNMLSEYIEICESNNLNFDLVIQEFDSNTDTIDYEMNIINNNHKNN